MAENTGSLKLMTQEATNAAIVAAIRQVKDYIDGQRTDIPITWPDAMAKYAVDGVDTASQALALAESELTEFVDNSTVYSYNPFLWYRAQKLRYVRYAKLVGFRDTEYNFSFRYCPQLLKIVMDALTTVSGGNYNYFLQGCTALQTVQLPMLTTVSGNYNYFLQGCTALQTVQLPMLTTVSGNNNGRAVYAFQNCANLERVAIGTERNANITGLPTDAQCTAFSGCPKLIDIEIGRNTFTATGAPAYLAQNCSFLRGWNPTGILTDPEKVAEMNKNIREHIAANCLAGSRTIYFNTNMKQHLTEETLAAFTDKGWTVAFS